MYNCYNVEIINNFDPGLQLNNKQSVIINKLKELVTGLKKFKVLVLDYKKRNYYNIFHSITKLIASDLDIDEAFKFMHQSIMTSVKNYACKDRIVLDSIIKHIITIFDC